MSGISVDEVERTNLLNSRKTHMTQVAKMTTTRNSTGAEQSTSLNHFKSIWHKAVLAIPYFSILQTCVSTIRRRKKKHFTYTHTHTNHSMGHEDWLEFSFGRFLWMKRDSAIFLSGWSFDLYKTRTLSGIELPSSVEWHS